MSTAESSEGKSNRTERVTPPNTRSVFSDSPRLTVTGPRANSISAVPWLFVDTAPAPDTITIWLGAPRPPFDTWITRVPRATSRLSATLETGE